MIVNANIISRAPMAVPGCNNIIILPKELRCEIGKDRPIAWDNKRICEQIIVIPGTCVIKYNSSHIISWTPYDRENPNGFCRSVTVT